MEGQQMTVRRVLLAAFRGLCAAAALMVPAAAAPSPDGAAQFDADRGAINLDAAPAKAEPDRAQIGNPLWAIPLGALSITRNRPVFTPSRKPPAPPPVVVAAPVVPPTVVVAPAGPEHPNLTLIGTVVGDNEGIGVFLDQATHGFVRMKTGEGHGGWVLRSIKAREVTLEKGPQSETLRLPARNIGTPPPKGSDPE
jgi:general secretion pathway protein N